MTFWIITMQCDQDITSNSTLLCQRKRNLNDFYVRIALDKRGIHCHTNLATKSIHQPFIERSSSRGNSTCLNKCNDQLMTHTWETKNTKGILSSMLSLPIPTCIFLDEQRIMWNRQYSGSRLGSLFHVKDMLMGKVDIYQRRRWRKLHRFAFKCGFYASG